MAHIQDGAICLYLLGNGFWEAKTGLRMDGGQPFHYQKWCNFRMDGDHAKMVHAKRRMPR